jgi:hypothetical protein
MAVNEELINGLIFVTPRDRLNICVKGINPADEEFLNELMSLSEEGPSCCPDCGTAILRRNFRDSPDEDSAQSALAREWSLTPTSRLQEFGAESSGSASEAKEAKYRVNLDSVLECQLEESDYAVTCETFDEAKEFVLDVFKTVIGCLTYLSEDIEAAKEFDDLDLSWESLIEKIEGSPESANDEVSR